MYKKINPKKRTVIIMILITSVMLILGCFYWVFIKSSVKNTKKEEQQAYKSPELLDANTDQNDNQKSKLESESTGEKIEVSKQPSINITNALQQDDAIIINALVGGSTSGVCYLTLTKGGETVNKIADVGIQVSYYICKGFTINSSEFKQKGEWTASIKLKYPSGEVVSEPRKVIIR